MTASQSLRQTRGKPLLGTILLLLTALLLTPLAPLRAECTSSPIPPTKLTHIRAISPAPPIRTAAWNLRDFLQSRGVDIPIVTAAGTKEPFATGAILLGTTADTQPLAAWAKEGRLSVTASEQMGDDYEIVVLDGVIAVNGANARAVLYGTFELEESIPRPFSLRLSLRKRDLSGQTPLPRPSTGRAGVSTHGAAVPHGLPKHLDVPDLYRGF